MASTPQSVLGTLEKGQYAPLYFLYGEEPFYIDRIAAYIEEHALSASEKTFNQTVIYGKEYRMQQVLESARRFPMMAKRQVIVVKEAQEIQDLQRKEAQEALARYAERPVASTVLVLCYKHKKVDSRTAWVKALAKHAETVESKKLYDNKVPDWVKQYCRSKGQEITDRAAFMLSEFIGNNLGRVANEIDKMLMNYQGKVKVEEGMVMKHIGISKEFNIFELQAALGKKDQLKVWQIINYFAANPKNNPAIPVVSMLYNYFTKLLLLHHNQQMPKEQQVKLLKINPYFYKEYALASHNYPMGKVLNILRYLQEADLQLKGINTSLRDTDVMKELVYKILQ